MNAQQTSDFTTLRWIKQELDDTLQQALHALQTYVEDPSDSSQIQQCADNLHQVQGTLRMVELYGAAMVAEEMERLAQDLLTGAVSPQEDTYSVLMRGIVQLPDYLERLQSGHKDIPIVLLPLLNDLRACRGQKLLSESALFAPNLDAPLPASARGAAQPLASAALSAQAGNLRTAYLASLLKWFRDDAAAGPIDRLLGILDRLRGICASVEARRVWWVAAGVIEGVQSHSIEPSVTLKLLFGKIDREIRRLQEDGEAALRSEPTRELIKNLLYYIAHARDAGPRSTELRTIYKLNSLLPSDQELRHAKGSVSGHNRTLLDTVAVAIRDDLLRVKEALDIFLRSQTREPGQLQAQAEVLDRVGDTLGMLGLGIPRRLVSEQRQALADIATGVRPVEESALLDIAGTLIYVESSLDDHIERLGATEENTEQNGFLDHLPTTEVRRILDALMQEAATNLAQAKQEIISFIEAPWMHSHMAPIPHQLEEVSGALIMLDLVEPAHFMTAIQRFVEVELLQHKRVPTAAQLDRLADAFASMEYYLEATRERRSGREEILNATRSSLTALGYWPIPERETRSWEQTIEAASAHAQDIPPPKLRTPEPLADRDTSELPPPLLGVEALSAAIPDVPVNAAAPTYASASANATAQALHTSSDALDAHSSAGAFDADDEYIEIEEEIEEEVPEYDFSPTTTHFESVTTNEIDADIRGVFLEEVSEEIENLQRSMAIWRVNPHDLAKLTPIRRSFHTLKGSGRLVGAAAIGEFGWKVENLLNRVLDRTVAPTVDVEALVQRAVDALPSLLAALGGAGEVQADLGEIVYNADRLVAGGEITALENPTLRMRTVKRVVKRRVLRSSLAPVPPALDAALPIDAALPAATGGSWSGIDPVLFDILRTEVAAHLDVVDTHLAAAAGRPIPVTEDLVRALHTLNGAIATVEIPVLGSVLAPLEAYIKGLYSRGGSLNERGVHALGDTSDLIKQVMAQLEQDQPQWPSGAELAREVSALRSSEPDATLPFNVSATDFDAAPEAPEDAALEADPATTGAVGDAETAAETESDDIEAAVAAAIEEAINQTHAHEAFVDDVTPHENITLSSSDDAADAQTHLDPDLQPGSLHTAFEPHAAPEEDQEFLRAADTSNLFELDFDRGNVADESRARDSEGSEDSGAVSAHEFDSTFATRESLTLDPADAPLASGDDQPPAERTGGASMYDDDVNDDRALEDNTRDLSALDDDAADLGTDASGAASTSLADAFDASMPPGDAGAPAAQTPAAAPVSLGNAAEDELRANAVLVDETPAPAMAEDAQPDGVLAAADIDDDLLEVFVQEGADILDHADALLTRLQRAPQDKEILSGLQRELHTLKGGARMANLEPIGDLSHVMESMLEAISEHRQPMTRAAMDSFERGFDRLHTLIQRVSQRQAIGMPVNAIARFEALVAGTPLQAADSLAAPMDVGTETFDGTAPGQSAPAAVADTPASATPAAEAPAMPARARLVVRADEEEIAPRATQEMIRVRAETLDQLVNFAGEVSIYRSRLEQQVGNFRSNLVELEQTVSRLRDQLRTLEMETEAQILSRFQREHVSTAEGGFDPLEMDRYSTLQQTSRALAESVSDLVSIQNLLDDQARQSETLLLQQSRVSSELQEGLMRTRMVPFESMVPSLRRILRQTAEETGKRAQLNVRGAQGEMDRNLLDRMKAPFEHMLRNALAHGIETPAERERAGKAAAGAVDIAVSREATEVLIRVSDDGRGLDRAAIRQRAIERGLMAADATPNDSELFSFILQTGFSTASQITQVAGRGVGMDVVHNEIKQLGGSLAIQSTAGQGSSFSIRLPFTLAVAQAILVRIGDVSYAIPMSAVQGVARIEAKDFDSRIGVADPTYAYLGENYLLCELTQLLDLAPHRPVDESQYPLLLTRAGEHRAAIRIDAVIGSREIVVKSVGPQISSVPGIFGATIMGDGSVVMILDLATMLRRHAGRRELASSEPQTEIVLPPAPVVPVIPRRAMPLIMVVDDSITMRKVTSRVLERSEMSVVTAKDGLDAIDKLQDEVPDLMLLDIEMPRMDGFELATHMRNDPRLRAVPIIMITSRSGDKHRQRALEIGVDRYLGKPYQEAELLLNIREILGAIRGA